MVRGQGTKRVVKGFTRQLTNSELKRCYVFISNDKSLSDVLDTRNFEAEIEGQVLPNRRIDKSGRIFVSRDLLKRARPEGLWSFQLVSRTRLKLTPIK